MLRRIPLARDGAIELSPYGFRVIESRGRKRSPVHPYESLIHVYAADSALLIGTDSGLITIRHSDFPDSEAGPHEARRVLLERLEGLPDGPRILAEMERVDELGDRPLACWAVWATSALCIIGTGAQLRDPALEQIGAFMSELFVRGEYWRAITAHFLHALPQGPGFLSSLLGDFARLPFHLAINVAGMLVLGHLLERPLGSVRTALTLVLSAVGTIGGILYFGHVEVVGASGLVAGLAGAILALELHYPSSVPSFWRLPRRLFIGVVLAQFFVIDQVFSSYLAGGAHIGGFVGGYAGGWFFGRPRVDDLRPALNLRVAFSCSLGLLAVGVLGSLPLVRHEMGALERHAARLLNTPPAFHLHLHENAAAWFIATEGEASEYGLGLAVALADRAVVSTQRIHPGYLDTLAEALFQSGDRLGALLTIDEAIRLAPYEPYYFEQRRRFTGERAPDDRPPPPGEEPFEGDSDDLPIDPDAPEVIV